MPPQRVKKVGPVTAVEAQAAAAAVDSSSTKRPAAVNWTSPRRQKLRTMSPQRINKAGPAPAPQAQVVEAAAAAVDSSSTKRPAAGNWTSPRRQKLRTMSPQRINKVDRAVRAAQVVEEAAATVFGPEAVDRPDAAGPPDTAVGCPGRPDGRQTGGPEADSEALSSTDRSATDLQVLDAPIVAKRRFRAGVLEAAVPKFLSSPNCLKMRVGQGFTCMPDDKWSNIDGMKLKFEFVMNSGDVFIISCSEGLAHSVAVEKLRCAVCILVDALAIRPLLSSAGNCDFQVVSNRICAPDSVMYHKPAPDQHGEPQATSLIVEVEMSHCSPRRLMQHFADMVSTTVPAPGGPVVAGVPSRKPSANYLLGIKLYPRDQGGLWAGVAVLCRVNWAVAAPAAVCTVGVPPGVVVAVPAAVVPAAGGGVAPAAAMVGMWSFGPRDIDTRVRNTLRVGKAPELAAADAAMPDVFVPAGPLTIDIPVQNLVVNHAAAAAALAAAVVPGRPANLTIDLEKLRKWMNDEI